MFDYALAARTSTRNNQYARRSYSLLKSAETRAVVQSRENNSKYPSDDRNGDTLFISELICGLWQRGRTRRVSAKMVTIDTGDTLDPGHCPERRAPTNASR